MNIDNLNNSQLILLVILLTVITSVAISVSTLALVMRQLHLESLQGESSVIVKETVNRIIEREQPIIIREDVKKEPTLTLDIIEKARVEILIGLQPFDYGYFISKDGMILVPQVLKTQKLYNVVDEEKNIIHFKPHVIRHGYTVLKEENNSPYPVETYIPLANDISNISIGKSALIFGKSGKQAIVHSEIISRANLNETPPRIKTSVFTQDLFFPSAVFVEGNIIGFIFDYQGWLNVINKSFLTE